MQSSHSWPEIVWCSWGLWVKPGSFCLPCLLQLVWPSTLLHSGPGNCRTVSHLVDSIRTSYGLLSQVSLSILHIMFLLAICIVLFGSPACVLSSACCKPVNGMPSEKQDVFHILKFETTGTCSVCPQRLPKNQYERSCFVATQVHKHIKQKTSVFRLWV